MNRKQAASYVREIRPLLDNDDDLRFWETAIKTILRDAESLIPSRPIKREIFLQLGACSHWLRPHQTRWTAAGGFAWPSGYLGGEYSHFGLAEFDWYSIFHYDPAAGTWSVVGKFFGKRRLVLRAVLPSRTLRHNQAAVHILWSPGTPDQPDRKLEQLYGFRKVDDEWLCVATKESTRPA